MVQLLERVKSYPVPIDPSIEIIGLNNPQYLTFIGFTTRNLIDRARRSKKSIDFIAVIEPSIGRFKAVLEREYLGDLIKDDRIEFLVGIPPQELVSHLYRVMTKTDSLGMRATRCRSPESVIDVFAYPPTETGGINKDAKELIEYVGEGSRQTFLAMGCAADSHYRWEQVILNERNIKKSFRVEPLFGSFRDVPAFVLGGGPSVDEFIEQAKAHNLHKKGVILACDAVLKKLVDNGIKPHFALRCERKVTHIFNGVTKKHTDGVNYAAYPWTAPEYYDLFDSTFMLFRGNGVCRWTHLPVGEVNGGVSSGNACMELAFQLGCNPIVLSGIDLGFIDGKSHTGGTEVEFDIEKSRSKWSDLEANDGSRVTTIPVWRRCLNEYAGTVLKYDGKGLVINTSGKGAKIPGTRYKPWSEVVPMVKADQYVNERIDKLKECVKDEDWSKYLAIKKGTSEFLKSLKKDLDKLLLNIDDCMLVSAREEKKIVNQLRHESDPSRFFQGVNEAKKGLKSVYEEPARQIDQFKEKYFRQDYFTHVLVDICQLDYFTYENKIGSMRNLVPVEHERMKQYVLYYVAFFRLMDTYVDRVIELLDVGCDRTKDFVMPDIPEPAKINGESWEVPA